MHSEDLTIEDWMARLKRAYEVGYYKTEAALGQQEPFPWQNKTCRDCPFWLDTNWCQVHAEDRAAGEHTCAYFDPPYRLAARNIIDERQQQSRRRFLDWFSGNH